MKHLSGLFFFMLISVILLSCSKSKDNSITTTPIPADTLSAGWAKVKVNQYIGIFYGGDVFFNSNTVGYTSDNNSGIFKSTDGGSTWSEIYRAGGRSLSAANIAVTADNKAFFVGPAADSIFRTTDQGATISAYNIFNARLSDIFFGDNNNGLCSSNKGLFSTANGGTSWTNIGLLPGYYDSTYSSLFMLGNSNAWVCYNNKVYHANGTLSAFMLDSVPAVTSNIGLEAIFATSPAVVYTCSYTGYIFKSVDGGHTFSLLTKLQNNNSSGCDIHFIDANTGYASLGRRIYKTTDAGNNWTVVVALGNAYINEIHFTDAGHGWACCSDGTILKFN